MGDKLLNAMETRANRGLVRDPHRVKQTMRSAGCLQEDILLHAVQMTDLQVLERTVSVDSKRVVNYLTRLRASKLQSSMAVHRFSAQIQLTLRAYFNSKQLELLSADLQVVVTEVIIELFARPARITQLIVSAGVDREVYRLQRKRSRLRQQIGDDTLWWHVTRRMTILLSVLLLSEASNWLEGGEFTSELEIGVCDVCMSRKVWAFKSSDNAAYNCGHCMCQHCTTRLINDGKPCPFCRTYSVTYAS